LWYFFKDLYQGDLEKGQMGHTRGPRGIFAPFRPTTRKRAETAPLGLGTYLFVKVPRRGERSNH